MSIISDDFSSNRSNIFLTTLVYEVTIYRSIKTVTKIRVDSLVDLAK